MIKAKVEYELNGRKYQKNFESESLDELADEIKTIQTWGSKITLVEAFDHENNPIAYITKREDELD